MAKLKFTYPVFQQPSSVVYGRGCLRALFDDPQSHEAAIFISGQASVQRRFDDVLAKQGLDRSRLRVLSKPPGEPDWEMIERGAAFLSEARVPRIVGVGGGSVLDWCRLSWLRSADLLDPSGKVSPIDSNSKPHFQLAPTTCATGAEAASVAVFSNAGRKIPVVSRLLLADQVLLDAQFLDDLSETSLSAFLCDALSHAVESYCSIIPSTFAKETAVSALSLALEHYAAPPSHERLEHLLEAGYLGGLAAAHCSVGVVHAFAHSVACWGISHSAGNAAGLVAGLTANREAPSLQKLAQRVGVGSVEGLVARIAVVTQKGCESFDQASLLARMRNESERTFLLKRILKDSCLRTNPIRLGQPEIEAFLKSVESQWVEA